MIKYFGRAFKITNENIILTTPLVLFFLLFVIYAGVAHNAPETLPYLLLTLITAIFMISAFLSGWFFMVKEAVDFDKRELTEEDRAKVSFSLLKDFPVGVGEYFMSFLGCLFLWIGLILLFIFLVYQAGIFFIGKLQFSATDLKASLASSAQMKAFISTLPTQELIKLNYWNFLILFSMIGFYIGTMFWPAEIINKNKNPFFALFSSLKFLFKNLFSSIVLFLYLYISYLLVSLVGYFSSINPFLYFFAMILYFYFFVYVVVLIFLYYDGERNKKGKVKLEEKDQGNCNCGTDSVGQESTGDSDSTED